MPNDRDAAIEAVLLAAEQIPPGRVATYGDLAELTGTWPRFVGWVMANHGGGVPWWRVVNANGVLVPLAEARERWLAEGIDVDERGRGCRLGRYRCDPAILADAYEAATGDRTPAPDPPATS